MREIYGEYVHQYVIGTSETCHDRIKGKAKNYAMKLALWREFKKVEGGGKGEGTKNIFQSCHH